jgi:hypothetical protein
MSTTQDTSRSDARPAAELVSEALAEHPGSTAAELAAFAKLGQSTVSKALASMEAAGAASRDVAAPVAGRRLAARWNPATRIQPSERKTVSPAGSTPVSDSGDVAGRLRPGQLGTLVLEYLLAHQEQEWSPTAVGKALGRSTGAVANALAKFAASGDAVLTSETPRRYRIVTT